MSMCGKCGVEIDKNAKYCKVCGAGQAGSDPALNSKKARIMDQERTWKKPLAIAVAVVAAIGALWLAKGVYMGKKMGNRPMFAPLRDASARLSHAVSVKSEGGDVRIPLKMIEDGNAHFFSYAAGEKTVTFFVMKASDGSIRTAYDACMACNHAKLGYRQSGDLVVCNNCGMGFKPMDIGLISGGCNPIPVGKSVDNAMIVLKAKDLEAGAKYF
jgi:predicted nucleic acid-binding Zn ribbon protein